jgi:hypothetical protein
LLPTARATFTKQITIWIVFGLAYQAVRRSAGRDRTRAFQDARVVIRLEQRVHLLFEPGLQRLVQGAPRLASIIRWSYWLSKFAVLVLALL